MSSLTVKLYGRKGEPLTDISADTTIQDVVAKIEKGGEAIHRLAEFHAEGSSSSLSRSDKVLSVCKDNVLCVERPKVPKFEPGHRRLGKTESANALDLFGVDVEMGLQYHEALIFAGRCVDFEDFLGRERADGTQVRCSTVPPKGRLMFHCDSCARSDDAALCVECFVGSDHTGHRVTVLKNVSRRCDCGNMSNWKERGCCSRHQRSKVALKNEGTSVKGSFVESIFSNVFNNVLLRPESFEAISEWLLKFVELNDKYMSLCSRAVLGSGNCSYFLRLFYLHGTSLRTVCTFVRKLFGEPTFRDTFAVNVAELLLFFLEKCVVITSQGKDTEEFLAFNRVIAITFANPKFQEVFLNDEEKFMGIFSTHLSHLKTIGQSRAAIVPSQSSYYELCGAFRLILANAAKPLMERAMKTVVSRLRRDPLEDVDMIGTEPRGGIVLVLYLISGYAAINKFPLSRLSFRASENESGQPITRSLYVPFDIGMYILASHSAKFDAEAKATLNTKTIATPLRFMAMLLLTKLQVLPSSRRSVVETLSLFNTVGLGTSVALELGHVLQAAFRETKRKNMFIKVVAQIFGMFTTFHDNNAAVGSRYAFFYFMACLFTDDPASTTKEDVLKDTVQSMLLRKSQSLAKVVKHLKAADGTISADDIRRVIGDVSHMNVTDKGKVFRATDGMRPFRFHVDPTKAAFIFRDALLPFEIQEGLEDGVSSPVLLAMCYTTLFEKHVLGQAMGDATIHAVLSFLVAMGSGVSPQSETQSLIVVKSTEKLVSIAKELGFSAFAATPFQLISQDTGVFTLLGLIGTCGEIGKAALARFGWQAASGGAAARQKARDMRNALRQRFAEQQQKVSDKFGGDAGGESTFEEKCPVCGQSGDDLYYQVRFWGCFFVKSAPMMSMCQHFVHERCVTQDAKEGLWPCPLDRMPRNGLIPAFLNGYEENPCENTRKGIDLFLKKGIGAFDQRFPPLIMATNVLLTCFRITDHRIRLSGISVIDSNTTAMLRCLFLVLWHNKRDGGCLIGSKASAKAELINMCAGSKSPESEFRSFVSEIAKRLEGVVLYRFLRFALLFSQYALERTERVSDWDQEMEFQNLANRFNIKAEIGKVELRRTFGLVDLPTRMLDLSLAPYNVRNIDDMSSQVALCTITGNVHDIENMSQLVGACTSTGVNFTYVILVTGKTAGSMLFFQTDPARGLIIPSVYADAFGDEDRGYERSEILLLDKNRWRQYGDMLLSGRWMEFAAKSTQ